MAATPGGMTDTTIDVTEAVREKGPLSMLWWYGWSVLHKCPGQMQWDCARGMATLAMWVVVTMGGYDIVTQDFLFGSQVTDLTMIAIFFFFSKAVFHCIHDPFRYGFIIIDPNVHHTVFLFFLLDIVLAICLAVLASIPGAISLAPGAVNPFPGTPVHEAVYIVVLVWMFLIALQGFVYCFAMMPYWGAQLNGERTYAFQQYVNYFHGQHKHWSEKTISVPPGYTVTAPGATFVVGTAAKSQSQPLLCTGMPQQQMLSLADLQKLQTAQSINQQNILLAQQLQQQQRLPTQQV
jgi:hypothetical protein